MRGLAAFVMRGRLQASGCRGFGIGLAALELGWVRRSSRWLCCGAAIKKASWYFFGPFLPLVLVYQAGGDSSGLIALLGAFCDGGGAERDRCPGWSRCTPSVIAAVVGSLVFMQLSEAILTAFVEWYVDVMGRAGGRDGRPRS